LKPVGAKSWLDPISKKPLTKRAGGMAQGVDPEVQTPVPQKKKKKKSDSEDD
jgi:hypothetical protein